ncbi:MAG: FUSC family protein, partial [Herbaspirillum sp.]
GCLITMLILRFVHNPLGQLAVLFAASVAAPAFTYIKYRYTAIAASVQILMLLNLLVPAGHQGVIGERLIDTLIGVVIATVFSYVLPAWEYRDLPKLLRNVLKSSQRYLTASRDLLEGKVKDDFFYRVCRKGFMDSLAALISALVRMMDEPATKQRAVRELNRFIVQNYLVAAHIAALRLMLRRHQENMPQSAVARLIEETYLEASQHLAEAQRLLAPKPRKRGGAVVVSPDAAEDKALSGKIELIGPVTPEPVPAEASAWSGWDNLRRRTSLLNQDLKEIVSQTEAIDRVLRKTPD